MFFDPEESISAGSGPERAAWAEAAVSMLRECDPEEGEAVLMGEPPKIIGEEEVRREDVEFEMGFTYVDGRESISLRIREKEGDEGGIIRIADYYPESKGPDATPFFPRCILEADDGNIYEWPSRSSFQS